MKQHRQTLNVTALIKSLNIPTLFLYSLMAWFAATKSLSYAQEKPQNTINSIAQTIENGVNAEAIRQAPSTGLPPPPLSRDAIMKGQQGSSSITPQSQQVESPQNSQHSQRDRKNTSDIKQPVVLKARLVEGGELLNDKVIWHVFDQKAQDKDIDNMMVQQIGGSQLLDLKPGDYIITADFGLASHTNVLKIPQQSDQALFEHEVVFNAGGIRLNAALKGDVPIDDQDVDFIIYPVLQDDELGQPLITNAPFETSIILNKGKYRVQSTYGNLNAVVRADVVIEPGKLTNIILYHEAAKVTLKLVNEPGGEALASTSWSVLTKDGTILFEATSAFPSVILAADEYQLVALNNEEQYSRIFRVESGLNRDVELVAK